MVNNLNVSAERILRVRITCVMLVAAGFVGAAGALEREVTIKRPSTLLPVVKVIEKDGESRWSVYTQQGVNFVGLYGLDVADADYLWRMADAAEVAEKEIAVAGGCKDVVVRSDQLGQIGRTSKMRFQVECIKNVSRLVLTMTDEYVVHFVRLPVKPKDLKTYAERLLDEMCRTELSAEGPDWCANAPSKNETPNIEP